jgi:hypothetical protein
LQNVELSKAEIDPLFPGVGAKYALRGGGGGRILRPTFEERPMGHQFSAKDPPPDANVRLGKVKQ